MRRMIVFAGIWTALCGAGYSQSKEKPASAAEQAVMRIERELLAALLKGDASANERYLAETYVFTGPDGSVEDRAQAIASLKSGDLKLQSASLDNAKVQIETSREFDLGGPEPLSLTEYMRALRRTYTARPAFCVPIPGLVARAVAHVCDVLHATPFSFGHWELLRRDNVPAHNRLPELLGRAPRRVGR